VTTGSQRFCLIFLLNAALALGQSVESRSPELADAALKPWGGAAEFSPLYRQSVQSFLSAEDAYRTGDYSAAKGMLDALWANHPPGSTDWRKVAAEAQALAVAKGVNFGAPPCYSALRMLTEATMWRLRSMTAEAVKEHAIRLTVVVVGRSTGKQPASLAGLAAGRGRVVHHMLNEEVAARGGELIRQSLYLFGEYIRAITEGQLRIDVTVLPLADLEIPVEALERNLQVAGQNRPSRFAGLVAGIGGESMGIRDQRHKSFN
jgi:hypothetical protein